MVTRLRRPRRVDAVAREMGFICSFIAFLGILVFDAANMRTLG